MSLQTLQGLVFFTFMSWEAFGISLYDNEIQYRPIIFITPLFRICNPEAVSADLQSANSSALQMHG
ncbi:MAG: hypothetical protein QM610_15850, partial [Chitinophagaceae bacterium]